MFLHPTRRSPLPRLVTGAVVYLGALLLDVLVADRPERDENDQSVS